MSKTYFSYTFRFFFAPYPYYLLKIARYYTVNNKDNSSKNNPENIYEKISNSHLADNYLF